MCETVAVKEVPMYPLSVSVLEIFFFPNHPNWKKKTRWFLFD